MTKNTNATETTAKDLERLAAMYGFVPQSVLDAWKQSAKRTDAERDEAQVAIYRGRLEYLRRNIKR